MICTLTARRLKPGSFDNFRTQFEKIGDTAPAEVLARWTNVYKSTGISPRGRHCQWVPGAAR